MDSVLSNEVARRIAADLATLVSEAEKHGTLPRIKSVAFYFNETELRTIIKLLRSCHGILDPAQTAPRTPAGGGDPELMIVGDNDSAGVVPYSANEALAEIDRLREELSQARALVEELKSKLAGSFTHDQYHAGLDCIRKERDRALNQVEELTATIKRIDAINDNPACFNVEIDQVCRPFTSTVGEPK